VTPSARLLSPLARFLHKPARLRRLTAIALACAGSALASAPPAGAVVTEVEGTTVGLTPRNSASLVAGLLGETEAGKLFENPSPESFANPLGHPVLHGSQVFVIYWDPQGYYHGDWQNAVNSFLHDAGSDSGSLGNVFAVDAQYTDTSNKPAYSKLTFRGAYTDTHAYPEAGCTDPRPLYEWKAHKIKALSCLTDAQIQAELQSFIAARGLPKGMGTVYYLLTPPGVTVCLDAGGAAGHCSDFASTALEQRTQAITSESYENSFCSYHSDLNPGGLETGDGNTVLYGVIPWTAGGVGDGQLAYADQNEAYYCQDGGFDPSSEPIEQKEKIGAPSEEEQELLEELEEEGETELAEEIVRSDELSGAHVQEPNQVSCPSADGFCDRGLADLIINQIAVEQHNVVTDPLLNAWKDSSEHEATDECRNWFAPQLGGSSAAESGSGAGSLYNQELGEHKYYLNTAFDLAALRLNYPGVPCMPAVKLDPKFTAPSAVNANEVVGFDGMESEITLNSAVAYTEGGEPTANYAGYAWSFGDGTPAVTGYAPGAPACEAPWLSPCAASVFHSYQYGGTYTVTLTVTDVGGNVAGVSHTVTVVGPAAPASAGAGSSSAGSISSSSSPSGSGSPSALSNPTISAIVRSKSLRTVLRHGLRVSYSVNEKVTGRFEVMIPSSLAHRLGLKGRAARGLAPGSAAQTVIETAFLSTTRGGRATLTIPFPAKKVSRKVAARLSHLRSAPLTVRLSVRNAHAGAATALSSTSLH
jgi:hypothetical protein